MPRYQFYSLPEQVLGFLASSDVPVVLLAAKARVHLKGESTLASDRFQNL